ncbi:MAG: hypothetical protein WBQ73_00060 [Candidatus Babeliales bacterium]
MHKMTRTMFGLMLFVFIHFCFIFLEIYRSHKTHQLVEDQHSILIPQ